MRTTILLTTALSLTFTLSACSSVEVVGDVEGTVLDKLSMPAPGVRVQIGSTIVTTDAEGHFSVPLVASPYDVTLVPEGAADPYLYLGITTHQPTLRVYDKLLSPTAQVRSTSLLLDLPQAEDASVQASFVFESPDDLARPTIAVANQTTPGQYPITVWWTGDAGITLRVHAFRFEVDATTGAPKHYVGYDTADLDLAGGALALWKASWKAPTFAESTVSVSASLPGGYHIWQSAVVLRSKSAASGSAFAWAHGSGPEVSFVVPVLPGATFDVDVCAGDGEASSCRTLPGLTAGTKGAPLEVEPGPVMLSPAPNEKFGVGTELEWDKQGEGTTFVLLYPQKGAAGPWYFLAADGDSATITDLGKLGVKLPSGLAYNLGVFRNGATESVDMLAEKGPFYAPAGEASTYAYSATRTVTSQ